MLKYLDSNEEHSGLQIKIGDFGLACLESKQTSNSFSFVSTDSNSSSSSSIKNTEQQHTKGVGRLTF